MKNSLSFSTVIALTLLCAPLHAQIITTTNLDAAQTVSEFILNGVNVSNVVYTGDIKAFGTFTGGYDTNIGMNNGIILTTGTLNPDFVPAIGSEAGLFSSCVNGTAGNTLLDNLISVSTHDASVLEFDLIPVGDILEFQYVFASEEYPEFVNSSFNDVFVFFIDGINPLGGMYSATNIALIPETSLYVSINNVNSGVNSDYFVDNLGIEGQTIVFDGFTTLLTANIQVVPETNYHLTLAIADAGDASYDSAVFLMSSSLKSYFFSGIETVNTFTPTVLYNHTFREIEIKAGTDTHETVKLVIYNLQGSTIYKTNFTGSQSVDFSSFANGIYLVQVCTEKGCKTTKVSVY
ncbi:MAG TPA: choice-of-anchor L domain-containing protein [Bacteroidales bacterium]|nr:choice-of-anchor L domain-containing protein [Bacteroidales bacterium]